MHFDFANVLVFFGLGVGLCALMLGLGSLLRPNEPSPGKLSTYECGEPPSGPAWINFNIRFYLIALVFVIFDVELAFIYPVAAVFREMIEEGLGVVALVEMVVFVGVLAVGLVYVWARGDLAWLVRTRRPAPAPSRRAA